jgi:hypothetical protein
VRSSFCFLVLRCVLHQSLVYLTARCLQGWPEVYITSVSVASADTTGRHGITASPTTSAATAVYTHSQVCSENVCSDNIV